MSTSITQAEITALQPLTWSSTAPTPEQLAVIKVLLDRAVADDGPTVDQLVEHWRQYAYRLSQDMHRADSASWRETLRVMSQTIDSCAKDLEHALRRGPV